MKNYDENGISITNIAADINRQNIFDMVIEEACRQWCVFADDAPERKDGIGFADFFYEIFAAKEDEYIEEYNELHKGEPKVNNPIQQKIWSIKIDGKQIIAEVDNEDNSIDVAVMIDNNPEVTLNVSVNADEEIKIRKWIGCGDSIDEIINKEDICDPEEAGDITMQ